MSKVPINHHYVPQFIIRKFQSDDSSSVYVFDCVTQKSFTQSPKNILYGKFLYSFNLSCLREYEIYIKEKGLSSDYLAAKMVYENKMKDVDGKISNIYNFIHKDKITYEENALLILFFAINYFRSLKNYENQKHGSELLVHYIRKSMKEHGLSEQQIETYQNDKLTEDEIKLLFYETIFSSKKDFIKSFYEHYCIVLESDNQFILGDTPFICLNLYRDDINNNGPNKNGSFFIASISKNKNILLLPRYLPLSLMTTYDEIESNDKNPYDIISKIKVKKHFAKKLIIKIMNLITPETSNNNLMSLIHYQCSDEDVEVLNQLQILNSIRFIVSENDISQYLIHFFKKNKNLKERNHNIVTEYYKIEETDRYTAYSKKINNHIHDEILQRYHKEIINIYRSKNYTRSLLYKIQQASRLSIINKSIPGNVDHESPIIYINK